MNRRLQIRDLEDEARKLTWKLELQVDETKRVQKELDTLQEELARSEHLYTVNMENGTTYKVKGSQWNTRMYDHTLFVTIRDSRRAHLFYGVRAVIDETEVEADE